MTPKQMMVQCLTGMLIVACLLVACQEWQSAITCVVFVALLGLFWLWGYAQEDKQC